MLTSLFEEAADYLNRSSSLSASMQSLAVKKGQLCFLSCPILFLHACVHIMSLRLNYSAKIKASSDPETKNSNNLVYSCLQHVCYDESYN